MTMADLQLGETGTVAHLAIDEPAVLRRMLDLGLTPGARVAVELANFRDGARAYRVRGALIAFRKEHASAIHVDPGNTR